MNKYSQLFLFDVDKTLISSAGGHKKAFSDAFKKVYDVDTTIDIINHHGMTEQPIIIKVLKKSGLSDKEIKSKINECMKVMVQSYNQALKTTEKITILKGVKQLLKTLKQLNVLLGLVTGNLEPIARGKLKKVQINHYFKVGGFGSDNTSRTKLVKIATKQAQKLNFSSNNNIILFGDTPKDVFAGKQAKVKTVGIATGIYTAKELKQSGANFVFKNLLDTDLIVKTLLK